MTREELEQAQKSAADSEDRRRLRFGYEALSVCTTSDLRDLSVREVEGRRQTLLAGVEALEAVVDAGAAGRLAKRSLAELGRRRQVYEAWIETHRVPRDGA